MKPINSVLLLMFIFCGCYKNVINTKKQPTASLNVVNSIISGSAIKLNSNVSDSAKSYNAKVFGLIAGESEILLAATDNFKSVYYNKTHEIGVGGVYSLYLSGQGSTIDALFMEDDLPPYYSDSSIGVRFINLSPNSSPVNITRGSSPGVPVFTNIDYMHLTNFIKFPLPASVLSNDVTFQVRDASTNDILVSYVLPANANSNYPNISIVNSRNRNVTLVIKGRRGLMSGNDTLGVFPVANY